MTLDPALDNQGFYASAFQRDSAIPSSSWPAARPPACSSPAESVQVPVYYDGWQEPWPCPNQPASSSRSRRSPRTTPRRSTGSTIQAGLQPPGMSSAAWGDLFANLIPHVGNTWGDFVTSLDQSASYLGETGRGHVNAIPQLWRFVIQQAMGFGVVPTIASNVDASVPGTGLSLAPRSKLLTFDPRPRNAPDPSAWGWTLDGRQRRELITQPDGSVAIQGPNGLYRSVPAR